MEYVKLGRTNLKVSRLCLGAMGFGSKSWRSWVLDEKDSQNIIDRAFDLGINFVDTCDFYSAGESELILKETLVKRRARDSFVLATKAGNPMAAHVNGRGYSRKHLLNAIDASLMRLGTDHVDLFQTHIWNDETELDELVDTMAEIVRAGKARYVGVTTMPAWTLVLCRERAKMINASLFVSMQCEYNPAHRECERELLPYCKHEGLALIPFSPMARGFLSAKRKDEANTTERTLSDDYTRKHYYRDSDHQVQKMIAEEAANLGYTPSQVALAWTLKQSGVTSPIFGATSVEHVNEAVAALEIELSQDSISRINLTYVSRPLTASGH
jgi:1-deoxyxylulose-5-phosphate synthase